MGLREQILDADDIQVERVEVPEWKATVYVRSLSADDIDSFEQMNRDANANLRGTRARLAMLTVFDEAGKPVFTKADLPRLGAKSGAAINRIINVASRLNGLSDKAVEEAAGNSVPGPSGGSTSV